MDNFWTWLAVMPIRGVYYNESYDSYGLDEEFVSIVEREIGQRRFLLSAGLWSKLFGKSFTKNDFVVFADSGGFQFLRMDRGKQKDFYRVRDLCYRWQLSVGDIVAGGDIPTAGEVSKDMLVRLAELTVSNLDYQFRLDNRLGDRFLNVMHGVSPAAVRYWYRQVKGFSGVGWAVGAKPISNVVGFVMQIGCLIENGEFEKGRKILHIFGGGVSEIVLKLYWFMKQVLDVDFVFSSDSSSMSLGKVGALWEEDGAIVKFDDVRGGKKKIELINGEVLEDVPESVGGELNRLISLTSLRNYLRFYKRKVLHRLDGYEPDRTMERILRLFKFGGIDAVWFEFSKKYKERMVEKLT